MEEPQVKEIPEQTVISLHHEGSYDGIAEVYRELYERAEKAGLKVVGKGYTVFHTSPSELDSSTARFEVCLQVEGKAEVGGAMTPRRTPPITVCSSTFKGAYSELPARYAEIQAWISAKGYEVIGPPREVYIWRPPKGAGPGTYSGELVTEIQFPIRK